MTVGTVFYAAPEQLMGEELDGRADQYALAATAFHLLSGSPPFHHSNRTVVISRHLTASPPAIADRRAELSALDPVLSKALSKDPKDRFNSCMDFGGRWPTDWGWSRRSTTIAPKRRSIATDRGAGQAASTGGTAAENLRPVNHRALDPGRAAARGDRPGADRVPRDRELLNNDYTPPPGPPGPRRGPSRHRCRRHRRRRQRRPLRCRRLPRRVRRRRLLAVDAGPPRPTATPSTVRSAVQRRVHLVDEPGRDCCPTVTVHHELTDGPLPMEEETPVRVCMQETGKTRRECQRSDPRQQRGRQLSAA